MSKSRATFSNRRSSCVSDFTPSQDDIFAEYAVHCGAIPLPP